MAQIRKFQFETCFDDPDEIVEEEMVVAVVEEPPPAPPPPAITEAELAAARAEAFAAGREAGSQAERASTDRRMADALSVIGAQLATMQEQLSALGEQAQARAVDAGLAVARALVPDLVRRHGLAEVEALLRECLTELLDEPRLVVRVADPMLDDLNDKLPALTSRSGFSGRIILLAEDGMQNGDCRIEWADGGVERNAARVLREIDAVAARLLPSGAGTADASLSTQL